MERFILADTQLWKGQSQQGHCGKVSHYRVTVKRSVTTGSLWKGQSLQGHCGKVSHYRGTVERSVTTGALWKGQSLQWHCAKVSHYRVTMERSVTTGNRVTVERSVTTGSLQKVQSLQGHCARVSHYRGTVQRSATTRLLIDHRKTPGYLRAGRTFSNHLSLRHLHSFINFSFFFNFHPGGRERGEEKGRQQLCKYVLSCFGGGETLS